MTKRNANGKIRKKMNFSKLSLKKNDLKRKFSYVNCAWERKQGFLQNSGIILKYREKDAQK